MQTSSSQLEGPRKSCCNQVINERLDHGRTTRPTMKAALLSWSVKSVKSVPKQADQFPQSSSKYCQTPNCQKTTLIREYISPPAFEGTS